eukprot:TRINITY_DN75032_c0_g1_i1.p1 TRINITY_DN75032_c0_g1~~TRINITY_DN75032_c0_g1_i1.p1  ORF type:complete len:146 (-),score=24.05 TRINITY_DN75032_c0_g1_i1:123-560(-)
MIGQPRSLAPAPSCVPLPWMVNTETVESVEMVEERLALREWSLQLQADADQRSSELNALQHHRRTLERQFWKCKQEKRMLEAKIAAMRAEKREAPACVVCLASKASHFMTPCGHLALCEGCCSLPLRQCPLCQTSCEQKIRLFRP